MNNNKKKNIISGIPFLDEENYIIRYDIIEQIHQIYGAYEEAKVKNWDEDGNEILDESILLVLSGKGGVGKSQIALYYAYHIAAQENREVIWLPCESRASVVHTYYDIAKKNNINIEDAYTDEMTQSEKDECAVQTVLQWLCNRPGFLLVCDNCVKIGIKELTPFLPTYGGHILVTSRPQPDINWESAVEIININVFNASQAREYMRLGFECNEKEIASANMLSEILGRYPLALTLARGYIKYAKCTFSSYLTLYRATPAMFTGAPISSDIKRLQRSSQIRTAQRAVILLMRQLDIDAKNEKLDVVPHALLDVCARVKRLPKSVLEEHDSGTTRRRKFSIESRGKLEASALLLSNYGLLTIMEHGAYGMHRTLQICIRPLATLMQTTNDQPPIWVRDEEAPTCGGCNKKFNVVRRRHHCRRCGRVFCNACSKNRERIPGHGITLHRVCDGCKQQMIERDERILAKHMEHRRIMSIGALSKQKHEDLTRGIIKSNQALKAPPKVQYSSQTVPPIRNENNKSRRTMSAWTNRLEKKGNSQPLDMLAEVNEESENERSKSSSVNKNRTEPLCPNAAEANILFVETVLDMIDDGDVAGVTEILDKIERDELTLKDFTSCDCLECQKGESKVLLQVKKDRSSFLEVLMRNKDLISEDPNSQSRSQDTTTIPITPIASIKRKTICGSLTREMFDKNETRQRRGSLWEIMLVLDEMIRTGTAEEALQAAIDKRRFFIDRSEIEKDSESDWSETDDYGF